ncbi:MAG TPA: hypothetical protein VN688_23250 [Gemmataceae bacterium]|nr:hypothetical protein [Gemmataceae bacterium]
MTNPSGRLVVISLVCGLTLAASGDDVCLLRIVAPCFSVNALGGSLSVDDPNSDFTTSASSAKKNVIAALQHQPPDFSLAVPLLAMALATSFLYPRPDADLFRHRDILALFLRC